MDNTIDTAVASILIIGTKLKMKHATYMPNTFHPASSFKKSGNLSFAKSPHVLLFIKGIKARTPSVAPSFFAIVYSAKAVNKYEIIAQIMITRINAKLRAKKPASTP